jgi:CTP:molybdopterin cytidylyltransferase MocA
MKTSAIILSAGLSSRIGFPKAFLKWDKETVILEKLIMEFKSFGINEIIIVVNKYFLEYYSKNKFSFLNNCIVVTNNKQEYGRFYSILLGCKALTSCTNTFIQNVDNPFTTSVLLDKLGKALRKEIDIVIPSNEEKDGHPVLLSKNVIHKLIEMSINNYDHNFRDYLSQFRKEKVNWKNAMIHVNLNTIEEYNKHLPLS